MWGVLNYHTGTRVRNGDRCVNISAGEALSTLGCHSLSLAAAPPEPGSQVCGRWGHSLHTVKQSTSTKRRIIIPNWLESTHKVAGSGTWEQFRTSKRRKGVQMKADLLRLPICIVLQSKYVVYMVYTTLRGAVFYYPDSGG